MKKLIFIIMIPAVVLLMSGLSFAGPHGHHGGHGWGGVGIYIGPGAYYPPPAYYPAPVYYPPAYYPAPYPTCETRCYKRVVPTCTVNETGERICRDELVRDCKRYCY